jgi:hypothetical protein
MKSASLYPNAIVKGQINREATRATSLTHEDDEICQVVLSILLERQPALVAFEKLIAEFPDPDTEQELPVSVIATRCVSRFGFRSANPSSLSPISEFDRGPASSGGSSTA